MQNELTVIESPKRNCYAPAEFKGPSLLESDVAFAACEWLESADQRRRAVQLAASPGRLRPISQPEPMVLVPLQRATSQ